MAASSSEYTDSKARLHDQQRKIRAAAFFHTYQSVKEDPIEQATTFLALSKTPDMQSRAFLFLVSAIACREQQMYIFTKDPTREEMGFSEEDNRKGIHPVLRYIERNLGIYAKKLVQQAQLYLEEVAQRQAVSYEAIDTANSDEERDDRAFLQFSK